jgi:hypothetical protein
MALQVACEAFITFEDVACDCGDTSEEAIGEMIDQASDIIAIITGGKVAGRCEDIVRPCGGKSCLCGSRSLSGCGCVPIDGITLRGPNPMIDEILIDGDPFEDYALVDGTLLVRTDGAAWPGYQDITLPSDQPGTFEIVYTYGLEVPKLAKDAAAEIVCSMLQSGPQDGRKTHPNTRGMNISGVQITLEQQAMEIKRRAPMLPYVIRLLTVYAPGGPTPAFVYSPELENGWTLHTVDHFPIGS